ncbi:MAG TPA: hypothetical protein VGE07_07365, partial [Herpetosiphonaceae bacterium]
MRKHWILAALLALSACGANRPPAPAPPGRGGQPPQATLAAQPAAADFAVTISGGYETDPRDRGRPVALIAAALGVPEEVFREAFSHVTPAGAGSEPSEAQARQNKAALMSALAPYGVTNERLDEVSNYYRYNGSAGELWPHAPAAAEAIVADGKVTGIRITDPGAGYTSAPTVTIAGSDATVVATLG